jgi:hypothetical protein
MEMTSALNGTVEVLELKPDEEGDEFKFLDRQRTVVRDHLA